MSDMGDVPRREKLRKMLASCRHGFIRSRFDISDLISDVEFSLWAGGFDSFSTEYTKADPALLKTISKRTLANALRFHTAKKRDFNSESTVSSPFTSPAKSPLQLVERKEDSAEVNNLIRSMGDVYWQIYHLRFFCDKPFHEIAEQLGLTRRQLDTRFKHLLAHVRRCLDATDSKSRLVSASKNLEK